MNQNSGKSPFSMFPLSTSSLMKESSLPGSTELQLEKDEMDFEELSKFSERSTSSSIANLRIGSELDIDFAKENYNNSSPIRRSTLGVGNLNAEAFKNSASPLNLGRNHIFEAIKDDVPTNNPTSELLESFRNSRFVESDKNFIPKLSANLRYLLSISQENKNLLMDSLVDFEHVDPSDVDQVHLLINYFKLINKMNKVSQQMGLNQFKLELIINNCMDVLTKINEENSNYDSSF
ncbi:hypothetical protein CLIB1444_01S00848 [[Candida] jaroonii]|uniref:Uncharacterized protein n=1 Tax=[Candida] jaroonii TaxID=467808 RepID=A0ACA9Y000_9ASCO|nr:hypothetical protein CLIB1444_01S00848 [[Candida] jaroonii]